MLLNELIRCYSSRLVKFSQWDNGLVADDDSSKDMKREPSPCPLSLACLLLLLVRGDFRLAPAVLASSRGLHPSAVPAYRHLARCRGSTRAPVHITGLTTADLMLDRRIHWGSHVPTRIRRWAYLIVPDATAVGIDPYLVAGVMRVESNGDPLAWNLDSDAHGLMQVLHASWEPAINLRVGISLLDVLQRQFNNRDLVLAGYNAGPGAVQQYGGVPPFPETRNYVVLVEYWRDRFAGLKLSPTRVARYRAALADLRAFHRRVCGGG